MIFNEKPFDNSDVYYELSHIEENVILKLKKSITDNIDLSIKDVNKTLKITHSDSEYCLMLSNEWLVYHIKCECKKDKNDYFISNIIFYKIVKRCLDHIRTNYLNRLVDLEIVDLFFNTKTNDFSWKLKNKRK